MPLTTVEGTPPGAALLPPPQRKPVLGPHARTDRTRNTRVTVPQLPAPEDGRSGEGQRLTPDAPHSSGRPPPPGGGPPLPPRHTALTGRAGQGDSVGPPHPHARAHSTWVADCNSPPSAWAVGDHPVGMSRGRSRRKKKPRKRRTAKRNKAKRRVFRPQKPPQRFYPAVWRGRKI